MNSGTAAPPKLSDQLERWLTGKGDKTLGGLVDAFGDKSFAILLVVLLAVPALPLPTGGVTHVFEIIGALIALELIAGRREVWLPRRWRGLHLAGERQQRFIGGLMRLIRRLERISRPRLTFLFQRRVSDIVFGLLVVVGAAGAFLAPPFSGLDTLPALGVVVLSLGVLLEDALIAAVGVGLEVAGVTLELALGAAAIHGVSALF
ncbi:MAG TPA: exopolysaccharide biosynthesis protein [Solirubrobacteraceae bacterium]|nr:exopolysaccharide biosynthesis protein [Solirubrobacteraceae bacterium]